MLASGLRLFNWVEGDIEVLRVLLTNTTWWPCASRLAMAFQEAGCEVSAIYPASGHPLRVTKAVSRSFAYSSMRPLAALAAAIEATNPHLVVPCDDRAVQHLHELHASALAPLGGRVSMVIENSLGQPISYPTVSARYALLQAALEEGLPIPDMSIILAKDDLSRWQELHPLPWVLKADGSWGGHGVKIVQSPKKAEQVVRHLTKPPSAVRTLKRLLVDRDPFWLRTWWKGSRQTATVQSYIPGRPANCAVACWNGKVLAGIAAEVITTQGATGSATVVRIVEGPEMMRAAERLARRLGLSGFFGLDFVIEDGTGIVWLIEMNPRVTPLCHLRFGQGRDLVEALSAQLSERPVRETASVSDNDVIAYFPQAMHWERNSELLSSSFEDVPFDDPDLVQELRKLPWPDRSVLARFAAWLRRETAESKAASSGFFPAALAARKSSDSGSRKT